VSDFYLKTYLTLLEKMKRQGFSFQTFNEVIREPKVKSIVLRHDVDAHIENSLQFAKMQHSMGIVGTYYFRIVPQSFDEKIIKEIAGLGHEIGYHYEDVSLTAERQKTKVKRQKRKNDEDFERFLAGIAIESFKENLERFRKIVPVKTICMHGSPMSRWDSRLLWKYYDYKDFGIVGEPYFDVNFDKILYLTDTGRRWDGGAVSIRDKGFGIRNEGSAEERYKEWKVKPVSGSLMNMTHESIDFQHRYKFRSTSEIVKSVEKELFPNKLLMTFHPQRWTDKPLPWVKELVLQNIKNVGKYFLVKLRK
jgi:hypothetical protein